MKEGFSKRTNSDHKDSLVDFKGTFSVTNYCHINMIYTHSTVGYNTILIFFVKITQLFSRHIFIPIKYFSH